MNGPMEERLGIDRTRCYVGYFQISDKGECVCVCVCVCVSARVRVHVCVCARAPYIQAK